MFKSKHSGWTWDLKRTPFGGGGGDFFSSIDPIEAIKTAVNGLADSQMSANDWTSENGWMLPLAVAGGAAGASALGAGAVAGEGAAALGGEVAADGTVFAAGETIPAGTAMADGSVAAAGGATISPDVFAGLSASAPVDTAASQAAAASLAPAITSNPVTAEMIAAANASSDPIGMMSYLTSATPEELAAATGPGAGASSDLASALKTANQVRQVAGTANSLSKLLTQGAGSGLSSSLGQLAKGANPQGQALTSLVRGNTNPFLQMPTQPIRNATTPDLASLASLLKQG